MITGGTGSFGNAVLNRFLDTDIRQIRIFSRDEKKQDDMRHEFQAKYPEASGENSIFYWRRPGSGLGEERYERGGLYFPCRQR